MLRSSLVYTDTFEHTAIFPLFSSCIFKLSSLKFIIRYLRTFDHYCFFRIQQCDLFVEFRVIDFGEKWKFMKVLDTFSKYCKQKEIVIWDGISYNKK